MDWLNIHRSTLSAEAFLGCEPVQRATWLCLLAYCADQENGGKIEGAEEWSDRKWQQVVRITKSEAHDTCPLWSWSEGVLTVWAYPVEKEEEVRRNRANGGKGGRPPKPVNNQVVSSGLPSGLTETITQTEPSAPISAETERKGKERKGKRREKESFSAEAEELYSLFPLKVAPDKAKKAIEEALKRTSFEALKAAVTAYAEFRRGEDPHYTKQPAGWFNDCRYLDDPSTWVKTTKQSKNGVKHDGFATTDYFSGLAGLPTV